MGHVQSILYFQHRNGWCNGVSDSESGNGSFWHGFYGGWHRVQYICVFRWKTINGIYLLSVCFIGFAKAQKDNESYVSSGKKVRPVRIGFSICNRLPEFSSMERIKAMIFVIVDICCMCSICWKAAVYRHHLRSVDKFAFCVRHSFGTGIWPKPPVV